MAFFKWKDSFNIGDTTVDQQHRSFMEILNEYYEFLVAGSADQAGKDLVDQLKAYAVMHFRTEENLMQSVNFEEIERHREQHRYFESLVSELEAHQTQEEAEALKKTLPFLRDWLLGHILEQDKKLALYLTPNE
jgi:hemerythrin-like metal-binding protein